MKLLSLWADAENRPCAIGGFGTVLFFSWCVPRCRTMSLCSNTLLSPNMPGSAVPRGCGSCIREPKTPASPLHEPAPTTSAFGTVRFVFLFGALSLAIYCFNPSVNARMLL